VFSDVFLGIDRKVSIAAGTRLLLLAIYSPIGSWEDKNKEFNVDLSSIKSMLVISVSKWWVNEHIFKCHPYYQDLQCNFY